MPDIRTVFSIQEEERERETTRISPVITRIRKTIHQVARYSVFQREKKNPLKHLIRMMILYVKGVKIKVPRDEVDFAK
jgi:hypothetical protein